MSQNTPDIDCEQHKNIKEGLPKTLYLSIGCKIMLRKNLWTEGGFLNGSTGTVHAIIYAENEQSPSIPLYILVKFDDYEGPTFIDGLFLIKPVIVTWSHDGITYSRKQLPVVLCYAITIHKSQGLTMENIIIDIG